MLKDDSFIRENAFLTAKGLVYFLHQKDIELSDYYVLILGYGNIAYYLAKILKALHVDFKIYTESEIEKKYLRLEGYSLEKEIDGKYDIIINTIPNNIELNYPSLTGCRVVDVASAPYGLDVNKVLEYNISYEILSAIPSKFAPASAAQIIKKFIENHR